MSPHPSIRRRLLAILMSTILLVWLAVVLLVYQAAEHEVEEVFDANLARGARVLQALLLHEAEEEEEAVTSVRKIIDELGESGMTSYPRTAEILRRYLAEEAQERLELPPPATAGHRYESGLAFVARHADGRILLRDQSAPEIEPAGDGYTDAELGDETWRVFVLTDSQSGFVIQVGEREAFRAELVRYITRNTLAPLMLALPVLAVLIWATVGYALRPLERVTLEVSRRAADALEPIDDTKTPHEIHGLSQALNKLFGRVRQAIARERQFTADAAHELRTPLAALKTHLQVARSQSVEPATRQSLDRALEGVDRATHSVEQLLSLARADADESRALVNAEVDLRQVAMSVVSALSQQAFERDIDLGVDAPQRIGIRGDSTALQVMLRNLVDNAIRYTPVGGTVTVTVGHEKQGAWIEVLDDGVGVAAEEREKLFDRFHRGPSEQSKGTVGSGLGLSIAQRIAELHKATISLGTGLNGRGLGVRVTFRVA